MTALNVGRSALSVGCFASILELKMSIVRFLILIILLPAASLRAESPAEQTVLAAIKSPQTTVVHLWAPWCSNCQAELKTGGWTKMINENPQVKFYFVSVWNDGQDGRAMLNKFGIADAAERDNSCRSRSASRRQQDQAVCRSAAQLDSDDLDLQRRRSPLRIELR